jgi:hypothetical protein
LCTRINLYKRVWPGGEASRAWVAAIRANAGYFRGFADAHCQLKQPSPLMHRLFKLVLAFAGYDGETLVRHLHRLIAETWM